MSRTSTHVFRILLILLLGCAVGFAAGGDAAKKCPKKLVVAVEKITPTTFSEYSEVEGPLAPVQEAPVAVTAAGRVAEVRVKLGDVVKAGDLLIVMDSTELQKEIEAVEARIAKLEKKAKSRKPGRAAEELENARSEVETRKGILKAMNVTAPIDGVVAALSVAAGDSVAAGAVAGKISDMKTLKLPIPGENAAFLGNGQKIFVQFKDIAAGFSGEVRRTAAGADVLIDNFSLSLKPGMVATLKVLKKEYTAVVVLPQARLLGEGDARYVYVAEGNKARRVAVVAGPVTDGMVLIGSGLQAEQYIITSGLECLQDGKKIKVEGGIKPAAVQQPAKTEIARSEARQKPEKVEPVKEPKQPKQPAATTGGGNSFQIGAGAGYFMMSDKVFKDVYGSGGIAPKLSIAYTIKKHVELYVDAMYFSKSGTIVETKEEVKFTLIPVYVGFRYIFDNGQPMRPYIGAAGALFIMKEGLKTESPSFHSPKYGVSLNAGGYYDLSRSVALGLDARYDIGKVTIEGSEEKADMAGLRVSLGVNFRLSR